MSVAVRYQFAVTLQSEKSLVKAVQERVETWSHDPVCSSDVYAIRKCVEKYQTCVQNEKSKMHVEVPVGCCWYNGISWYRAGYLWMYVNGTI